VIAPISKQLEKDDIAFRKGNDMTTYSGNQAVQSGYYFNSANWSIQPVAEDGARLPATEGTFYAVPTVVALLATPILGLAFLVFLPFIGFLLTFKAAVAPVAQLIHGSAGSMAATMSPGWQPGEAHLTGKRAEHPSVEEKGPTAAVGEELEALEQEIARKRKS
jgi:hypothetical protein